jgi:hypothetical protein
MKDVTTDDADESLPDPSPDELWVFYAESPRADPSWIKSQRGERLGVGLVTGTDPLTVDFYHDSFGEPRKNARVDEAALFTRLDSESYTMKFDDCLDVLLGNLTPLDVADILKGEPSYVTGGRTGYQAARFAVLDGIDKSIEEFSRLQGHGPGRYGRSVENRVKDLPEWIIESAIEHEEHIWTGSMMLNDEDAARLVELLLIREEYLDEDIEHEAATLVAEYDLEYDRFRECPSCGYLGTRVENEHVKCNDCDTIISEATDD